MQHCPALLQPASVSPLLETLDSLKVCIGNPEERFIELCDSHHGHILSPDGSVAAYKDSYCSVTFEGVPFDSTVRASKCNLIVSGGSKCDFCRKYRSVLRAMDSRRKKCSPSSEKTAISSHVNFRYLSTPEKTQRLTNLRAEVVQQKRKIEFLEEKVKMLTEASGVEVDKEIHDDLGGIMEEMTEEVEKQFDENSFERVFWNQQLQAKQVKDHRQMRWHPALIKWCLSLKMLSSSSYRALRSSGVLVLPSERTLRDYTHWMESGAGFSDSVDRALLKEAKIDSVADFQKHVCLVFDEVRIKEDLVYDKHSLQIIGFVNLGNVSNELLRLQRLESGQLEQCVAKHMLVFMVRNLFSKLEFPYAQFPCSSLSADLIFPLVWDCVKRLESYGFKVMALTADGASCNRNFFRMHGAEKFVNKTINVFSKEKRPIFFLSDVPHLIKTVRNCWSNSHGHTMTRKLEVSKNYRRKQV